MRHTYKRDTGEDVVIWLVHTNRRGWHSIAVSIDDDTPKVYETYTDPEKWAREFKNADGFLADCGR